MSLVWYIIFRLLELIYNNKKNEKEIKNMKKLCEHFTISTTSKIGILFKHTDIELEFDDIEINDSIIIDEPDEWIFDGYDIMDRHEVEKMVLDALCEREHLNPNDIDVIDFEYDIEVEDAPHYVIDSIEDSDKRDRRDLLTYLYNQMC